MKKKNTILANMYDDIPEGKKYVNELNQKDSVDPYISLIFTEFEFGLNLDPGVIYINGEIDDSTFYDVVAKTNLIIKYRANYNLNEDSPITLIINSLGGDVYPAFGIIDYIRTLPIKVNTICRGRAMSAAAWILACGTGIRAASKNSSIMFHEISSDFFGKGSDVKQATKHLEVLENSILNLLEQTTNKSSDWWKTSCIKDAYFTPTEAVSHGIIDSII